MLVLKRRKGETLVFQLPDGRTITVVVVDDGHNQTRLGTDAPPDVTIVRGELLTEQGAA